MRDLRDHLGVATTCGKCAQCVKGLIEEYREACENTRDFDACIA